jgi:hypothetical protein
VVSLSACTPPLQFDNYGSITFEDNTFFGVELKFGNAASHEANEYHFTHSPKHTHSLVNNLLLADQRCRMTCTENYVVEFFGRSKFVVRHNRIYYGYFAMLLSQPCSSVKEWDDNVMMGNRYGFWILKGGCTSLRLQGYRNGVGVAAARDVVEVSNLELVENGIVSCCINPWAVSPTMVNRVLRCNAFCFCCTGLRQQRPCVVARD